MISACLSFRPYRWLFALSVLVVIGGLPGLSGCSGDRAVVSAAIGPSGGEVSIPGGASVLVPAGALLAEVEIEVREGAWPSDVDYAATPVWHFGPDGLGFLKPVEVTIPISRELDRNDLALFWTVWGSSSRYEILPDARFNRVGSTITVSASIDHFSSGYVGSGNPEVCAGRYETESVGVVRDRLTGLSWYREAGFLADNFGDSEGACRYKVGFRGHDDWRLPTVREMLGLVSGCGVQKEGCCMPDAFGECGTNAGQLRPAYWTGTVGEQANSHYAVDYSTCDWSYSSQPDGGMVTNQIASFHLCVAGESTECQPMCGARECGPDPVCEESCGLCDDGEICTLEGICKPSNDGQYRDNGDSTVTDLGTGLTWYKSCPLLLVRDIDEDPNCASVTAGGQTDWRIPSIDELRTLVAGCDATAVGGKCQATTECVEASCLGTDCAGCPGGKGPGPYGVYKLISQSGCPQLNDLVSSTRVPWADDGGWEGYYFINYYDSTITVGTDVNHVPCVRGP